jgi:hypothetical protein
MHYCTLSYSFQFEINRTPAQAEDAEGLIQGWITALMIFG